MTKSVFVFLNEGGGQIAHIVYFDDTTLTFIDTPQEFLNTSDVDHVIAVLAGEDVSTWAIDVPDIADNKLLQILPAQLEDMKAVTGSDDHYALLSKNENGSRLVACVSAKVMETSSQTLAANGIQVDLLIPDYLLLSKTSEANIVHAFDDDDRYMCRLPDGSGFSSSGMIKKEILSIAEVGKLEFSDVSYDLLLGLNLLQGRYKRGLVITAYLPFLRRISLLLSVMLLVWGSSIFLRAERDQAAAATLRAETEALFRATFPEVTRIVNMEAQARRRVAANGPNMDGGSFLRISEGVFMGVSDFESAVLEGLRFNQEQNSFFVTVSFAVFADSDSFLSQLRARGLNVTEGGSRQEDSRVITDIAIEVTQ